MAVSQAQIVDLLYKQAFGVTKTDTATNKSPSNESIPSPLLLRGDTLWTQADQIPGTAAATAGIVQAYTGTNAVQCTADNTTVPIGGIYPTWKTNLTYWIPSEFGSTYNIQIWVDSPGVANPTSTGTQIFADGSGGTGQWYYNYQSGVLNFIGETIPASLTSGKVIYVVGYRYIGLVGVTNLPDGTVVGNLSFTGSNISSTGTNANINLTPNGTGVVTSSANVHAPNFIGNVVGNITGNIQAAGSNTQVQFNDGNIIGASANFTFDKATSLLTVNGILSVTGNTSIGGNINMNNQWINNLGYPNLSTDAATKSYVDTMVSSGLAYHPPVNVATTTTLAIATGGTTAYNSPNGAANGIGAYISTTGTFLNIDGANVQTAGTRILVKNEANAAWNGVYVYSNTTAITRATDADEYGPDSTEQLSINDYFFTLGGVVNEGTAFVVSAPAGTITFGTSNITFSTFSQSQVYDAGTGIDITGTTISTTANQSHVTAVGNLTSLSVVGNANIGNIGTAGLITATGNLNAGNIITGGIVSATGNGTFGNISTAGLVTVTGNITGANIITGGVVTATGNITGANLVTGGLLTVTGNANVGNLGTAGLILATGNITGGNIITGGVVNATGNINGANLVGSYGVYSPNITANTNVNFSGAGNVFLGNVSNLHITGGSADQVLKTDGAGNLSWSSGSILANGYSNVSIPTANGNVIINANGGTDQQWVFGTDGVLSAPGNIFISNSSPTNGILTDNLYYSNGQPWDLQEAAGSNTQIQFNDGNGNFGASANLTFDFATQVLSVTGSASVTGNANVGNLNITGSGGNITGANIVSANTFTASSNVNVGNTKVGWGTVTTTAITANQTIAEFSTTGIAAIEFLVKGEDSTGGKYSVATVTAVTDGTNVDYATYATAFLTSGTGALAVNISGGNVALQVTPSSSNSTVWTTQYRVM